MEFFAMTNTSDAPLAASPAPAITVTETDLQRLQQLLAACDSELVEKLEDELSRANVVAANDVPQDVVTMDSEVVYEDSASGSKRRVRIVYPQDADVEQGKVSVLAPLGSALLGLSVGQTIEWLMPNGKRLLRVVSVPYQPEAARAAG
jgi:regulator of nucleoside diphosphate kinase